MLYDTPDKKLLDFLNQFGVGDYKDIIPELIKIFPTTNQDDEYNNRITLFLDDMREHEFIKTKIYKEQILAAIQPKGQAYLKSDSTNETTSSFVIHGNDNQIQYHSSSSNMAKSSATPQQNRTKHSRIKEGLKIISTILGFVVIISGIIKGCIEIENLIKPTSKDPINTSISDSNKIVKQDSIVSNKNDTINPLKKPSVTTRKTYNSDSLTANKKSVSQIPNRTVSADDIAYILNSVPDDYFIPIKFQNSNESEKFAQDLYNQLTARHYKAMGYMVDTVPFIDESKKFLLVKSNDTAIIYIKRIRY